MKNKADNLEIVTVKDLLQENLTIPEYQRPYKWSTESALTLLIDCCNAYANNTPEYRIGSVVLHRIADGNKTRLNVVDGQQRLTTLSIMFFAFGDVFNDDQYGNLSTLLDERYKEPSGEAIVSNFKVIKRKAKEIDVEMLKKIAAYILDRCTFVKIVTDNEQEAFQFFDSQNSRGKKLAPHDLLKSYHLREMGDEPENEKVNIISKWESVQSDELKDLFSDHLYPLVKWYKKQDGLGYDTKEIKTFKGINKNSNRYNFSIYNKAANLYIERFNTEKMYELISPNRINQFQLTQPLIAGKRFFQYCLHYEDLHNKIETIIISAFSKEELLITGPGDRYVYNMFINVIMFYADKFNIEALTIARLRFFYKWAFSLRLCMKAVYLESTNKYAKGENYRINGNINMFFMISEMSDPSDIDAVVVDEVTPEMFKNSKVNAKKYEHVYKAVMGREEINGCE